jgi:anti-sigma regulatory factor (Ser/Thr protein kinase)
MRIAVVDGVLNVRVLPDPRLSRAAREAVTNFVAGHSLHETDAHDLLTAFGEALANAFEHAHAAEPIAIEVRIEAGRILATVADRGVGLPTCLMTDAPFPDLHAERGRGLAIMRRCCDIFAVSSTRGEGTVVVIGRYLRDSALDDVAC